MKLTAPFVFAAAAVLLSGAVAACGNDASQTRKPNDGGAFVPQARPSAAPAVLGSREGGEVQGVKERYVVGVGLNLRVNVRLQHPNKRTARQVIFSTVGDTIPPVTVVPNYNAALVDVPLAGAPEGVHEATIVAVYDGNEPGEPVNFQVQVGSSTAPARRAPDAVNPTGVPPGAVASPGTQGSPGTTPPANQTGTTGTNGTSPTTGY